MSKYSNINSFRILAYGKITYFFIVICLYTISCNGNRPNTSIVGKEVVPPIKITVPKVVPIIIDVQPFSDISSEQTTYVFTELKKIYPSVELKTAIPLPEEAYYPARNRYRADSLLNFLSVQTKSNHVVIALTSKDISCTNENYADWGIIGYGFCPGNACVVSTFRLDKNNVLEQLFKASIHELGHTQGLDHCADKTCFMRDAEGKNTTDEEKDFCPKCKGFLTSKGWMFKK